MENRIRILVVDDSAFARSAITKTLETDAGLDVIGAARDGAQAVEMTKSLKPDVVTMDVTMPNVDGIAALDQIMRECPTPVVMLSALTTEGAEVTIRALELGAVDFFLKPSIVSPAGSGNVSDGLTQKIKIAATARIVKSPRKAEPAPNQEVKRPTKITRATHLDKVVMIASSTGGPQALCQVIPAIPGDIPALLLIVQHMPSGFTRSLAKRLDHLSEIDVVEAEDGMMVRPGMAILAPGDFHMMVGMNGKIILNQEPQECGVRPSANITMESMSRVYGKMCLGVVLTGMGSDGTRGSALIRAVGGEIIAEDESTCSVYGMPASVAEAGFADNILPLPNIAQEIVRKCREKSAKSKGKTTARG